MDDECVKSDDAMKPAVVQTSPIILTPTIVEPSISINSPNSLQRFRKILPKLDNNASMTMQNLSGKDNNLSTRTTSNSYIVIIPTFNNTKLPTLKNNLPPKLPLINKKIPVLKLTVSRKYDSDQSLKKTRNETNKNNSIVYDESGQNKDNMMEEVVINHTTLNKLVVFSLDKMTDEISVSFRDNSSAIGRNAKLPGTHMKLRENPPKRKNWDEPEHLKTMYKRAKRDCFTLRSRLHVLRNKHEKEKAAIGKLQKKLVEIENNTLTTSPTPRTTQKSFEMLLKSAIKITPKNIINEKKLSIVEKTETIKPEPTTVNKKRLLKLNNNEDICNFDNNTHLGRIIKSDCNQFVLKANRPNGHDNSLQIDEAIVTVPISDVEHLDLYENIIGSPYLNDRMQ